MNKTETIAVIALFVALLAWMYGQQQWSRARSLSGGAGQTDAAAALAGATNPPPVISAAATDAPEFQKSAGQDEESEEGGGAAVEEQRAVLSNSVMAVELSSRGAGVASVTLPGFRARLDRDSGPVVLDFSRRPALVLDGVPGLGRNSSFSISVSDDARSAVMEAEAHGVRLTRRVELGDGYQINVVDTFRSQSGSVPEHRVALGSMRALGAAMYGVPVLGVDTLRSQAGAEVVHWASRPERGFRTLAGMFGYNPPKFGCGAPDATALPAAASQSFEGELDWAAVKNQYFVQILAPDKSARGCEIRAERDMANPRVFTLSEASAALRFRAETAAPGSSFTRSFSYYAGPKKYEYLRRLGNHQDDVMELGSFEWYRWICRSLLWALNFLHGLIPNYGMAIILLTAVVRFIFWPITHFSNVSMKKMQELQPQISELRQKYKDNPQKLNQEVMELYRRNKVNPMAGCVPMLVQLPVLFGLFTVLRSAVELRFAGFLWIRDLSQPENLLQGVLPIPLNILPLVMTGLTIWQSRLTPSSGDPQQQKMMMFMPLMMLFLFYNMASALVLYWTVSQMLAIAQLLMQRGRLGGAAPKHA